jgi:hypothetical protein
MIVTKARTVRPDNPSAFAWAGLRRFQNIELIVDELMGIHRLDAKWRDNVRKQAQQMRYCIIQAREYFTAAQSVSLATKPNLLYYGTMSLALAEILFKQSGNSSLDKARAEHRHHGLVMTVSSVPRNADLPSSSTSLRASPMIMEGKRKGTFHLWHNTSREHPLGGIVTRIWPSGGSTSRFEVILGAIDFPYPAVPDQGVTLLQCITALPFMVEYVGAAGLATRFVRGKIEAQTWPGNGQEWRSVHNLVFHPSPLNSSLLDNLIVHPKYVDRINIFEADTGYNVQTVNDWVYGFVKTRLPPAAMINSEEWRMWVNSPCLNEFGYFYVALFLAGNYARYFPDKWLLDVERSTPLALAIEELCTLSEWRVPWLSLSELGRNLLVLEK